MSVRMSGARAAVWAMSSSDRHFNVLPMSRYLKK